MFTNENFIERTYEKHCPVKPGDVVFDAGANCGSFTHSILGKNPKHVYCIEPSNTLIHSLKKNVGHGPVTFINKAISDTEENSKVIAESGVYIYENDGNEYPTTTFKKIIQENNIKRIDFLKFDCEGGEYSIFTEENYEFIVNHVKHCAGEWHVNDHKNAIEKFIEFRDSYLTKCSLLHVYERSGKEVTEHIFDDSYLYGFREYWKDTYLGQFIIYFTLNNSTEDSVDIVEVNETEKMDIVLQGQYEEYTDEIVDEYLKLPFVNNVIVSCWDNDRPDNYHSPRVKYARSSYPLTPGTCNKNLQITTSFAGIKLCRTKFSAKMRTDQKYDYNSMMNMYEFFMENHTESRIFVAGLYPSLLFHPRDHIYWGDTIDLHYLFDIPLEYNSLVDKVRIGKYELAQYANYLTRPETYIGAHYCTKFDDRIKKMLIEPENYLYDGAPLWHEAHQISTEVLPKAFKVFPRTGIDLVWPKRDAYSYPYDQQKLHSNECWHEDGF
jgi:FkbM family methyltransferase